MVWEPAAVALRNPQGPFAAAGMARAMSNSAFPPAVEDSRRAHVADSTAATVVRLSAIHSTVGATCLGIPLGLLLAESGEP
ncbi:MAG: hypothetical protein AAF657_37675 [Acidobacteriota bacterium]